MHNKIIACAGAGKTSFIIRTIENLSQQGSIKTKSEAIVLVFSVMARKDFQGRLKNSKAKITQNQVMTIHSAAGKLVGSASRSVDLVVWKAVDAMR